MGTAPGHRGGGGRGGPSSVTSWAVPTWAPASARPGSGSRHPYRERQPCSGASPSATSMSPAGTRQRGQQSTPPKKSPGHPTSGADGGRKRRFPVPTPAGLHLPGPARQRRAGAASIRLRHGRRAGGSPVGGCSLAQGWIPQCWVGWGGTVGHACTSPTLPRTALTLQAGDILPTLSPALGRGEGQADPPLTWGHRYQRLPPATSRRRALGRQELPALALAPSCLHSPARSWPARVSPPSPPPQRGQTAGGSQRGGINPPEGFMLQSAEPPRLASITLRHARATWPMLGDHKPLMGAETP